MSISIVYANNKVRIEINVTNVLKLKPIIKMKVIQPLLEKETDSKLFELMTNKQNNPILAQKAFTVIIEKYKNYVWRICLNYCENKPNKYGVAEEIALDTFYKAYFNSNKYDGRLSAKGWLGKVANNASLDYLKGEKNLDLLYLEEETVEVSDELITVDDFMNTPTPEKNMLMGILLEMDEHKYAVLRAYLRHFNVTDFGKKITLPPYEVEILLKAFPEKIKDKYYIPKLRDRAWQELLKKCKS